MSNERSDRIYGVYLEALQKFDYFVTGVSLALISYLGAGFQAMRLGWNPGTVELGALVALLASAIAGLRRIEAQFTLIGLMHRRLYEEEATGDLVKAAMTGRAALNEATGEVLSPAEIVRQSQRHAVGAEFFGEKLEEIVNEGGFWYRVRDFALVLGLGLLLLARVAVAYVG